MAVKDFLENITSAFTDAKGNTFSFHRARPVEIKEIKSKEQELGLKLPASFVEFLQYCGAATYFGVQIFDIRGLYAYDDEWWEMKGFLPFCVDAQSNHYSFKPLQGSAEYPVYRCVHSPFGYGAVADSFEHWLKLHYEYVIAKKDDPKFAHPYLAAEKEVEKNCKRYQQTAQPKWWPFGK